MTDSPITVSFGDAGEVQTPGSGPEGRVGEEGEGGPQSPPGPAQDRAGHLAAERHRRLPGQIQGVKCVQSSRDGETSPSLWTALLHVLNLRLSERPSKGPESHGSHVEHHGEKRENHVDQEGSGGPEEIRGLPLTSHDFQLTRLVSSPKTNNLSLTDRGTCARCVRLQPL